MKRLIFFGVLFLCLVNGQQAFAAVTPLPATYFWHDTAVSQSVQPPLVLAEKKIGFFGKVKATLLSLLVKRTAAKQASNTKRDLNIIALSMVIVGLAVPILGGPGLFLLLIPASLITGIVALAVKNNDEDKTKPATANKKSRSNAAAITAIIISGGLLLLLAGFALFWRGGHF